MLWHFPIFQVWRNRKGSGLGRISLPPCKPEEKKNPGLLRAGIWRRFPMKILCSPLYMQQKSMLAVKFFGLSLCLSLLFNRSRIIPFLDNEVSHSFHLLKHLTAIDKFRINSRMFPFQHEWLSSVFLLRMVF